MVTNFETNKGKFAFVKIANNWKHNDKLSVSMGIEQEILNVNPYYHPFNIEEIGFVKDLTEKQWGKVLDVVWVDCCDFCGSGDEYYPNYLEPNFMDFDEDKYYYYKHWFIDSEESAKSLLKSLGLTNENLILIKYT